MLYCVFNIKLDYSNHIKSGKNVTVVVISKDQQKALNEVLDSFKIKRFKNPSFPKISRIALKECSKITKSKLVSIKYQE